MKKLRMFSIALLFVSVVAFLLFKVYQRMTTDNIPPVITCETDELVISVYADTKDLLRGVTVQDDVSGDVTDSLVVESLSSFTEEGIGIITYAAVDESLNVARCERTIVYKGYRPPVFELSAPLSFTVGEKADILSCITAESVLDGNLTSNIKYSMESTLNNMVPGSYPVEFRVMDSCGNTVYLDAEIEIYERIYAGIDVELSRYLVYIPTEEAFDPAEYYVGASQEGILTIQSDVDTRNPGTYYVDYFVEGERLSGKSRLIVVVQ